MDTFRVLGISGSLRIGSHSTDLLRGATTLTGHGVSLDLWSGLATIPPFNEDHEDDAAAAVLAMRAAITEADALLIATPEYNTTIPGQLKNAIDWASRPYAEGVLVDKPVAVVGVSPSDYGAGWAQQDLRKVLTACGARVADRHLCVPRADNAFGPDGKLTENDARTTLALLLDDLSEMGRRDMARRPRAEVA